MTTWYKLAEAEIGTKEIPGESDNPDIVQYFEDVGHAWVKDDETAWCAAFLGAMLERAGIKSTRALNARSYLEWGKEVSKPRPGTIVVFWRDNPDSWKGHVAFATGKENTNQIEVLGGNQSNQVNKQMYPKGRILGFREPVGTPAQPSGGFGWIIPVIIAIGAAAFFLITRS